MQTGNNDFQKRANMVLVMDCIYRNREISRAGISRKLGLIRSTVSNLVQELLNLGVVKEGELSSSTSRGGRKGRLLGIDGSAGVIAGVELDSDNFTYQFIDINGNFVKSGEYKNLDNSDFKALFLKMIDLIREDAKEAGLTLIGISAGFSGVVDSRNGVIVSSYKFNLENFNFYEEVAAQLDIPVIIENDARACAWGELWNIYNNPSTFCYLFYRVSEIRNVVCPGFSMGVVVDGNIHRGASCLSGEFSQHFRNSINWRYKELLVAIQSNKLTDVDKIMEEYYDVFYDLLNHITFIDPHTVFIGYKLRDKVSIFEEALSRISQQGDNYRIKFKVLPSTLGELEVCRGAASIFLKRLYSIPQIGLTSRYYQIGWEEIFSKS